RHWCFTQLGRKERVGDRRKHFVYSWFPGHSSAHIAKFPHQPLQREQEHHQRPQRPVSPEQRLLSLAERHLLGLHLIREPVKILLAVELSASLFGQLAKTLFVHRAWRQFMLRRQSHAIIEDGVLLATLDLQGVSADAVVRDRRHVLARLVRYRLERDCAESFLVRRSVQPFELGSHAFAREWPEFGSEQSGIDLP